MTNFKEITLEEIKDYKDPFHLFSEGCIALAESKKGANALTLGWGALGTLYSIPTITIYINKARYSKIIFDEAEYYSVCFFNKEFNEVLGNYYGKLSGRDVDKVHEGPLTLDYVDNVPVFKEAELIIIAKVTARSDFDADKVTIPRIQTWYKKDGPHTIYNGTITRILKKD